MAKRGLQGLAKKIRYEVLVEVRPVLYEAASEGYEPAVGKPVAFRRCVIMSAGLTKEDVVRRLQGAMKALEAF